MGNKTSSIADLKPGDLIEIHRPGYSHLGVYVGDGFIVHVTAPDGIPSAGSRMFSSSNCGAVVKKQKLDDVAGKDSWNIGNHLDEKYQPRPAQVIVKEAIELVGQTFNYEITTENCEHFSNYLRYGKKESLWQEIIAMASRYRDGSCRYFDSDFDPANRAKDKTTTTMEK